MREDAILKNFNTKNMHILDKFAYCPKCGSHHFAADTEKSKKCENCGFEYFLNPAAAVGAFIVNAKGELLVERRKREPAKGTLDLPGGFSDINESAEESVRREVKEETLLTVTKADYLFSLPNIYHYSNFDVHTLDFFFKCEVEDETKLAAADDAAECFWLPLKDLHIEQFGLRSVRHALHQIVDETLDRQ